MPITGKGDGERHPKPGLRAKKTTIERADASLADHGAYHVQRAFVMRISLLPDLGSVEGEDQGDAKDTAHRTLVVSKGVGEGCGGDGSLQKSTRDESLRHLWDKKENPHVCQACDNLICIIAHFYPHTRGITVHRSSRREIVHISFTYPPRARAERDCPPLHRLCPRNYSRGRLGLLRFVVLDLRRVDWGVKVEARRSIGLPEGLLAILAMVAPFKAKLALLSPRPHSQQHQHTLACTLPHIASFPSSPSHVSEPERHECARH